MFLPVLKVFVLQKGAGDCRIGRRLQRDDPHSIDTDLRSHNNELLAR